MSKFDEPFVIQLRQFMPGVNRRSTFFTAIPDSFAHTNLYRENISLKTSIGLFIASLAAPDINTIADLLEMGKTLEERKLITFPGKPLKITATTMSDPAKARPTSFKWEATYADTGAVENPLMLTAIFTDHPFDSFMTGQGKNH